MTQRKSQGGNVIKYEYLKKSVYMLKFYIQMVYNITKNVDNSQYKHYFWFYKELSNDGCTKNH